MIDVLSLGAGVQSTTVALMVADGTLPPLDAAIFADTQSEPSSVYRHLAWLETRLPFPVHRVTAGSLREEVLGAMRGERRLDGRPPFHTASGGVINRQCTAHYKIDPIYRELRRLVGLRRGQRGPTEVVTRQWFGISLDEAQRMRDSRVAWIENRYPLIDLRMTRADCLRWLAERGHPRPPKSACTFCPFHNNVVWRAMKRDDPESWADAVRVDEAIRDAEPGQGKKNDDRWFVHYSGKPLADVDLTTLEDHGQGNLFGNECEGLCGV